MFPWEAAFGIAGGFMGQQDPYTMIPGATRAGRKLYHMGESAQRYGRGVPGSDPSEAAMLASLMASIGNEQAGERDDLLAMLGDPASGVQSGNVADAMTNLSTRQSAQSAGARASALLSFFANRQRVRYEIAPQLFAQSGNQYQGAARAQPTQGGGFGEALGNIAEMVAYNRNRPPSTPASMPPSGGSEIQTGNRYMGQPAAPYSGYSTGSAPRTNFTPYQPPPDPRLGTGGANRF